MFLKPFKVKNNTPLKSSEVKKLKQRILVEFPNINPDSLIASKSNVVALKLVTHGNVQTNVYCVEKVPMLFENEENKLVPTVYSLWQVADLLPYFETHVDVFPKLSNGADLMLPGVVPQGTGMNIYGHYKRGQLVGINLTTNKSAIGIGYLIRSSDDLYMSGGHGVAVKILHLFGDKLWAHEPSLAQQVPQFKDIKLTDDDFPALGLKKSNKKDCLQKADHEFEQCDFINQHNDVEVHSTNATPPPIGENEIFSENNEPVASEESTPEMLLKHAFLSALKNNGKNLKLPLLTSNFYRLYVVPEAKEAFDLKKTKYKKLSNFLNEMIEQGFIVIREESKGVDKITYIDFDHPELVNFITDVKKSNNFDIESHENPLFYSELTELYTITDETAPLFTKLFYKRGSGIPASQIKKVIREYINKQNLVISKDDTAKDKSFILDNCLEKICNLKVASLNTIVKLVTSQMDRHYQMCGKNEVTVEKKKQLINMSLATRSYHKKVTLVNNLECYGIILSEFIKLCKQGAAASTTIITQPNNNREVLQIQGNQIRFVYNLLTEVYKIPPKCILGLELARDGKKHKKK